MRSDRTDARCAAEMDEFGFPALLSIRLKCAMTRAGSIADSLSSAALSAAACSAATAARASGGVARPSAEQRIRVAKGVERNAVRRKADGAVKTGTTMSGQVRKHDWFVSLPRRVFVDYQIISFSFLFSLSRTQYISLAITAFRHTRVFPFY